MTGSACSFTGGCTRCRLGTSGCSRRRRSRPRTTDVFRALRPGPVRSTAWAQAAREAGMKYFVRDDEAPRRFLPVGLKLYRLQGHQDALRQGPAQTHGQGIPRSKGCGWVFTTPSSTGTTRTSRSIIFHPQRDERAARQSGRSGPRLRTSTPSTCMARSANCSRSSADRRPLVRFLLPRTNYGNYRARAKDWQVGEADQDDRASCSRASSSTTGWTCPGGDIVTPEQYQPPRVDEGDGKPVVWEACQTLSGSLGLPPRRDQLEESCDMLVQMLIDTVSAGRQSAAQRRSDRAGRV